jgi:hypothetical protein
MSKNTETRAQRLNRRYTALMNYLEDSAKARKAQHWSEEKIFKTYGVRIPKTRPDRVQRESSEEVETRRQRAIKEIRRFTELYKAGFEAKKASKLKRKSDRYVSFFTTDDYQHFFNKKTTPSEQRSREKYWSKWASETNKLRKRMYENKEKGWSTASAYPEWIEELAKTLNQDYTTHKVEGTPDESSYGYAVIYEAMRRGEPIELWATQLKPDRFIPEMYERTVRVIRK